MSTLGPRHLAVLELTGMLRRLAATTWAGAILGLVVGGLGGRLAMLLLARLNPAATGVVSDDGFVMGRLTTGTQTLLVVGTALGVLGGGIYFVLRGLRIGPRWFQVLSLAVGSGVVVASLIVHQDGVDFTLLGPPLLAISLFVAIPVLYAALLTVVAEHWLRTDGRASRWPWWIVLAPLVLWLPLLPVALLGLAGIVVVMAARQFPAGRRVLGFPGLKSIAWVGLAALFVWCVADLTRDVMALT